MKNQIKIMVKINLKMNEMYQKKVECGKAW